ncbi:MAG TPA: transcriptional repressor LexA [Pyrinomonadaceae bacterium]
MPKQKLLTRDAVLQAINAWIVDHGLPPTVEELRRKLKLGSTRTVLRYLSWLEDEGDIERWSGARGIRLLKGSSRGFKTRAVPLVGEAPAGPLMIAEENREGWVKLPQEFVAPADAKYFLLRVRGDSMNQAVVHGEYIDNGDLVVVRQQSVARPGEIIVALVDGEATIKRLVAGPNYYLLKPESKNKQHTPIVVTEDFQVQGVVTRVLKKGAFLLNEGN